VAEAVSVPVIASGGYGEPQHLVDVVGRGTADAVAFADTLHYTRTTLQALRAMAREAGIPVRQA
jgi:cyclase